MGLQNRFNNVLIVDRPSRAVSADGHSKRSSKQKKSENRVLYIRNWSHQKGKVDEKHEFEVLKARKQRSWDIMGI
jgi:hypothetical protein